jgi:hypothetical protein
MASGTPSSWRQTRATAALPQIEYAGDGRRNQPRVAQRGQVDKDDIVGIGRGQFCGDCDR